MGRLKKSRANRIMKSKNKAKEAHIDHDGSDDGMDDEIDKFHKNRDKIPLEGTDSEDEFENPVLNIEAGESDEDEEEAESDDDIPEEEINSMAAKIERQAKILRQRTGILRDEDDDGSDEDGAEQEHLKWGQKKRNYYAADNIDFEIQSSDEEGPALEEAEARRLQRKLAESLRPEDFDQDVEEDLEDDETLEKRLERGDKSKEEAPSTSGPDIERVIKDSKSLSKDEKMQIVMSNAPELVGLLTELKASLHELEHIVQPLLRKLESGTRKEAKSYVEVKEMLLLNYCQIIVFYLLIKAEIHSVCDHPVIARLVEIRMLLDKVRSLDKKLQPQVDKFLHLEPQVHLQRKSGKNAVKETIAKRDDIPVVDKQHPVPAEPVQVLGEESKNMLREMKRLEEKASRDRLLERTQKSDIKVSRSRKRRGGLLDDLEDDLGGGANTDSQPKKILQVIAEAGIRRKKSKINSGDADLPVKEDIGERRRKHERQMQNREPLAEQNDDDKRQIEDEFYQEAKKLKAAKETVKAAKVSPKKPEEGEPDGEKFSGKRLITQEMVKNRGLTPYRKKATKNPRKKYKVKHGKAVSRRTGQVRLYKPQTGPYGGESTGIRTNLSRSIRFT